MTTLETLKAARKKIENPKNWVQNSFGNRQQDIHCAATALCRSDSGEAYYAAFSAVVGVIGGGSLTSFNDTHTHAEVLRAFDEAIAKLEAA